MSAIVETINRRISCRSYSPQSIQPEILKEIREFLTANTRGPFGSALSFHLFDFSKTEPVPLKAPGTYGLIKGAVYTIAGSVKRGPRAMEDYGYGMEKNVLFLTDLGLGTCWLGGLLKRSAYAKLMALKGDELIPAVTPTGHPASKRAFRDSLVRWGAGSKHRKSPDQLFYEMTFDRSLNLEPGNPYAVVLESVRRGPSASNHQPWRIVKDQGRDIFHFFLCPTRGFKKTGNEISIQHVDMGIAMAHFELPSRELGLNGRWQVLPPPCQSDAMIYIVSWAG